LVFRFREKYLLGRVLGGGSFSAVHMAIVKVLYY
jgi:hypothetical protein